MMTPNLSPEVFLDHPLSGAGCLGVLIWSGSHIVIKTTKCHKIWKVQVLAISAGTGLM